MENTEFLEKLKSELIEGKKGLETIKLELDKAQAVGLDVSELSARYNAQKKQIELIEKVYKI